MMRQKSQKQAYKTHILQQDQSDCGVACLLSILRFYESTSSLEKLRELSGTTQQGTTLLGLYQAANQLGFTAEGNEADIQALIDHEEPLILHVLLEEKLEHYVVCYGYTAEKGFLIGDPAKGTYFLNKEELSNIWQSKVCLTLTPNQDFVSEKTVTKSKKEWFINLLKDDKKLLLFSLLLGIGFTVLNMAMAVFSQKLIDDILPSQKTNKLIGGIILLAILLLVRVGFSALRSYMLTLQAKDFNNRIVNYFYSHLLSLPKPFFDTRKIGELTARLNDTSRIQRVIQYIINNFVIDALMVIISLGFLFYYNIIIGCIALVSFPVYFFLIYRFNKKIIEAQKETMQAYALNEANYISSMQGIAEIKNQNKQSFFKELNQHIYGNFQEKIYNLGLLNIRISLYSGIAGVVFLIAILTVSSFMVFNQTLQLGELMAVLGIAGTLLPSATNLALVAIPINEAKIAFDRMFEFTSIDKEKDGITSIKKFSGLEIKNLNFRFAGRSQLLKDISLQLNKGEIVALVGESGCGKSTLGQILQKFYTWESGEVIINQKKQLKEIRLNDWRTIIGVIPQEVKLFNGTILDNILLGETPDEETLQSFVLRFHFQKFIESLPQGWATIVGEEGINLSGGQKQLLALMRALYKKPQLLILDEPTAAMDRETEKFSLEILKKIQSETAVLLISHRLDTLKNVANKIYVLEKGVITVQGTHQELIQTKNFYSDYFNRA